MFIALLMSTIQTKNQLAQAVVTWSFVIDLFGMNFFTVKASPSSAPPDSVDPQPVKRYSIAEFEELLLQEETKPRRLE